MTGRSADRRSQPTSPKRSVWGTSNERRNVRERDVEFEFRRGMAIAALRSATCSRIHSESRIHNSRTPSQWHSIRDYSSRHSPSDECQTRRFAACLTRRVRSTMGNQVPLDALPRAITTLGPTPPCLRRAGLRNATVNVQCGPYSPVSFSLR